MPTRVQKQPCSRKPVVHKTKTRKAQQQRGVPRAGGRGEWWDVSTWWKSPETFHFNKARPFRWSFTVTYRIDPDIAKTKTPITLKQHKAYFKKILNDTKHTQYRPLLFTYNGHSPASVSATYPSTTRVCVTIKYKTDCADGNRATGTDTVNVNTLKTQFENNLMDIVEQEIVSKGVDVQRITSE